MILSDAARIDGASRTAHRFAILLPLLETPLRCFARSSTLIGNLGSILMALSDY